MSHFLSKSTYEIIEVSGVLRSCDTFVISSVFILSPFYRLVYRLLHLLLREAEIERQRF